MISLGDAKKASSRSPSGRSFAAGSFTLLYRLFTGKSRESNLGGDIVRVESARVSTPIQTSRRNSRKQYRPVSRSILGLRLGFSFLWLGLPAMSGNGLRGNENSPAAPAQTTPDCKKVAADSWAEHQRQHDRFSNADRAVEKRVLANHASSERSRASGATRSSFCLAMASLGLT